MIINDHFRFDAILLEWLQFNYQRLAPFLHLCAGFIIDINNADF